MTKIIVSRHDTAHGTPMSYVTGFAFSIFLTITAYLSVSHHLFSSTILIYLIAALALLQAVVQLVYFLHLGSETKPRWKLGVFLFMIMVVIILVGGSLWIMNNLNYHHVTPAQQRTYIHEQDGL